ncbi:hypothetical protein ACQ856_30110 (plasmid) [Mycolicibacterium psychrotolerans]|uniref:hypothetical protein n=1 Tax=Mycolicibacterium psychrotolerans TaxID=216929 RepID=UPI003D66E2A3
MAPEGLSVLDEACLNALPQGFGQSGRCQVVFECADVMAEVGGVTVGAGGVGAAELAPMV